MSRKRYAHTVDESSTIEAGSGSNGSYVNGFTSGSWTIGHGSGSRGNKDNGASGVNKVIQGILCGALADGRFNQQQDNEQQSMHRQIR